MNSVRGGHRFNVKKGIVAPWGVTVTVLALLAAGLSGAQAMSDPVFGEWTLTGYTDRQTDPNPPADPDGQAGEDNLVNVIQFGERQEEWVPGDSSTDSSGWVLSAPDGDGWLVVEQRIVTDLEATETTVVDEEAHWQRYSWTGGPHASDDPPSFPSSNWQPNVKGDPHGVGQEGAYYRSYGGSGKGDWFYLEWVEAVTHVECTPAVTHVEYRYERTVEGPGHTKYYWPIYERQNTPGEPEAPVVPEQPVVQEEPVVQEVSSGPGVVDDATVPLSIEAGR